MQCCIYPIRVIIINLPQNENMRHYLTGILCVLFSGFLISQPKTLDELRAKKAELQEKMTPLKAQIDPIQAEMQVIDQAIANLPGWYTGLTGLVGANFLTRHNWYAAGNLKNSSAASISGSFNGFINNIQENYFWRNKGALSLGWQRLKTDGVAEDEGFKPVADILNVSSLFGYNIKKLIAISALGEYRTSVIENFNNPGYLDIGAGVTITPVKDLVFVIHPANFNKIFSQESNSFTSSLGCKFVGDYSVKFIKGVTWKSNISGFVSYKASDPALHNGIWTNWITFNIIKGLGIGLEHGLRMSPQERVLLNTNSNTQNYYVIGISYTL